MTEDLTNSKSLYFSKGLCPECSDKLNYRSKKREIKRLKKRGKSKKSKKDISSEDVSKDNDTNSATEDIQEEPSTSSSLNLTVNTETDESLWKKGLYQVLRSTIQ
jgi:protein FRA10AC1